MSDGYTKLFSTITDSTIWQASDATRLVWITMLAMADQHGYVGASIPGLASRARVSLDACIMALDELASPDKYSRTPEFEGRRIADTDGGWVLLNHAKYRAIRNADERRAQSREAMRRLRESRKVDSVRTVNTVSHNAPSFAQAEAEAEALKPRKSKNLATEPKTARTRPGDKSEGAKAWEQYAVAYRARYHVDPVRNAKTNGQFAHLVARLGSEAGDVAAHYVASGAAFYVQRGHAVDSLIRDAEKLRMEWATGRSTPDGRAGNGAIGKTAAAVFDLENLKDEFNGRPR